MAIRRTKARGVLSKRHGVSKAGCFAERQDITKDIKELITLFFCVSQGAELYLSKAEHL